MLFLLRLRLCITAATAKEFKQLCRPLSEREMVSQYSLLCRTEKDELPFREQLELDSMDFLDIVLELRRRYTVQIPEEDYPKLVSMQSTVEYLTPLLKETAKV